MDAPQPNPSAATKDVSSLPPPATHSPRRPAHCCRRVAIACCSLVVLFLLTLALNVLVHWIILNPKQGTYALIDASLSRFTLTHDTANSSYSLDADVDLKLLFYNPNKRMGLIVKDLTAHALIFSGDEIGGVAIPAFHQARRNDTTVTARVSAVKRSLSETVGGELLAEIERSNIAVRVVVRGRMRGDVEWYASLHRSRRIRLTCVVNVTAPRVGMNQTTVIEKRCGL